MDSSNTGHLIEDISFKRTNHGHKKKSIENFS